MRRPLMLALLTPVCLLGLAACSDDDGGSEAGDGGDGSATTATIPGQTTMPSLAPTTTFMPTCGTMPAATTISQLVGVPVADGIVVASGTCQFIGINDQSLSVFLGHLTDAGDVAEFNSLQNSLGPATAVADPVGSMIGPDGTVFIAKDGAIYWVSTMVTGGPAIEQGHLSAAVLKTWLEG